MKKEKNFYLKDRKKIQVLTVLYLYLFLLIMPYFIINLTDYNLSITSIKVLAFFYSIFSFLLTFFTYKNFEKIDDNNIKKRITIFKKGLLVVFLYFFTTMFQALPLLLITNDINRLPLIVKTIYLTIYEIIQVGIIIYILKDEIINCLKDMKQNHKFYFSNYAKYYLLAIIVMMISNVIISFINSGNIAGNEQAVRDTFAKAPIYMYFSAVIIAPLMEELTFRQSIRNIFSNNTIFVIASGLIFGGLHVMGNVNSPVDLLYLIPYSAPGIAFAYMLYKTNNVLVPIGFHFLHNGITMSLQMLLMFIGV